MTILSRIVAFLLEVALGVLIAAAVTGLVLGIARAVGHPLGEAAVGTTAVLALAGCVGAMVLRREGALRRSVRRDNRGVRLP